MTVNQNTSKFQELAEPELQKVSGGLFGLLGIFGAPIAAGLALGASLRYAFNPSAYD